ncbi:hypothetical protein ACS0TY_010446 [Phlomoides rotata]
MEFRPEHFITYVSRKYPQLWALKGANPIDVRRWYGFGTLASISTIAPVASEDTTNVIKYPSFHFMKLQRPDKKARPSATSRNKRQNQHLWSTSRKMRYPQEEHVEFEPVSRRWTMSNIHLKFIKIQ